MIIEDRIDYEAIDYQIHDDYIEFTVYDYSDQPYFCFYYEFEKLPMKTYYYSRDEFDFEGKILREINDFWIVKNKRLLPLDKYIKTCHPEEATMLKLKYL